MVSEKYHDSVHMSRFPSSLWVRAKARAALLAGVDAMTPSNSFNGRVTFLCGHYVFDDQAKEFEGLLKRFLGIGEFLNTDDALEVASGRVNCDGTYFHLSFDDGLECLARNAVEPLLRLNIPSLVFINSSMAGEPSVEEREAWVRNTNYKKTLQTMSWQSLRDSGFEVGAHTRTHVRLSHVALQAELEREIVGCKEEIESNLGLRCDYFAWPYGSLDDFSTAAKLCVKRAGYRACFGAFRARLVPGVTDLYAVPRHHFEAHWSLEEIRALAYLTERGIVGVRN